MAQPDIRPEPFDVYRCRGCAQLLTFDANTRVPSEQLAACQAKCDWLLLVPPTPTPTLTPKTPKSGRISAG